MRNYLVIFLVSFPVAVLDQLTKWLVRERVPMHSRTEILPSLDITHVRNPGIAFGMLSDMPDRIRFHFYVFVFAAVACMIVFFLRKLDARQKILMCSLALVLGGAVGNSVDRFLYGYVTDFVAVYWPGNPDLVWPPFNVADSAITVGAISVLVFGALLGRGEK